MPREKEGFRDQLAALRERFPDVEAIDIKTSERILGRDRRTFLSDKTFPAKKVGGTYMVTVVGLARWLA